MLLESLISNFRNEIEHTLRDVLSSNQLDDQEYLRMLHYHMGWDAGDQVSESAGKRTRPILTILCASAAGGDWEAALPLAAGVELIHNFSLIHDDIQDNSRLRRKRPSVWALWGRNQAINAGDALFTYAHLALHRATMLPGETRLEALHLMDEACIALTKGQHLDMAFEDREEVRTEEYMIMIAGKTAALIATAAELGALSAGAPEAVRNKYHAFGHDLGLAFQIRDDLLGIWGDVTKTGKSTADDIESGKKTLPILYGLVHSPELRRAYRGHKDGNLDAHIVRRILEDKGAREYAEAEERRHAEQAMRHLAEAEPRGEAGETLMTMILQMLRRVH